MKHSYRHPVRSRQLTTGERAADAMRNGMGSWGFVGAFCAFLGIWVVINSIALHNRGFDRYPYILLNLFLSMLAAIQGAILLIAAKRADAISADLAEHDYNVNEKTWELTEQQMSEIAAIRQLTEEVHKMLRRTDKSSKRKS